MSNVKKYINFRGVLGEIKKSKCFTTYEYNARFKMIKVRNSTKHIKFKNIYQVCCMIFNVVQCHPKITYKLACINNNFSYKDKFTD